MGEGEGGAGGEAGGGGEEGGGKGSTYRNGVVWTTEYTELQPLLPGVHSVMRVKSVLAGEGGGCTPTPYHLHLPSPVKLQCTLQLSGQIH